MVTFDASLAGTAVGTWDADSRMHDRPQLTLDDVERLIVVAAHPDDETLGAGGLIAECVSRGIPSHVVVVTDGNDRGLATRRHAELRAAMGVLGSTFQTLGVPDGAAREHRDEIHDRLAPLLVPNALVAAPWRGDGHRDHRVIGEVAAELVSPQRLLEYPIWLWHWGVPADVPWERLVSVPASLTKQLALAEYASQTEGDDPVLRRDFLANFDTDTELFVSGS